MIIPLGAAHQGVNFHLSVNPPWSQEGPIEVPPFTIVPADRQYPLRDDAEVFRVCKAARGEDETHSMRFPYTLGTGAG